VAIGSPHGFVLSWLQRPLVLSIEAAWRLGLKTPEEVMEILEAFDATGSLRAAAGEAAAAGGCVCGEDR
jgi:hypothetical protein